MSRHATGRVRPAFGIGVVFEVLAAMALALAASAAAAVAQPQEPATGGPYGRLVIRGATLIDGTGSPPVGPVDIVIERNAIADVQRVTPLDLARGGRRATGDRVIEADGMYVMPGIIDAHTHMGGGDGVPEDYVPKLYLGHGITTMRVYVSGPDELAVRLARAQRGGQTVVAPHIKLFHFWRGSDARYWSADGARAVVREWKAQGFDGIKVSGKPGLLPDVLRAIADEAKQLGMGVAVHIGQDGVVPMNAVEVAAAGATTIEHHYGYAESSFTDRTVQDLTASYNYGDELQRFRATGRVWDLANLSRLYGAVLDTLLALSRNGNFTMVPTFSVYEDQTDLARAKSLPWLDRYALPVILEDWKPSEAVHGSFYFEWTSADEAAWGRLFTKWLPWVNEFKNRGGHVAVGSDAGTSFHLYGFGTIRELELMQRAGFHPLEIVRSATLESARAVGAPNAGVIRPGYQADVLVVEMNPLEDFKVLYGIGVERISREGKSTRMQGLKYTIVGGQVIDARAMLRDVERMVEDAKRTQRATGARP
ncbi:MAG: amidohydrolase family protein [Gemmatimonadetes bacterium]|nr:amidohydrolase family protein [Gemmatimonadota bacterium]